MNKIKEIVDNSIKKLQADWIVCSSKTDYPNSMIVEILDHLDSADLLITEQRRKKEIFD